MLDSRLRPLVDPSLDRIGRLLAGWGVAPDAVTLGGLALGLGAALLIALHAPSWALLPLLGSRLLDGLDGAVARAGQPTDFGGYLDIFCDFVFYASVPLAFAWADPANALPAAFVIASFYVNAASFLGFAVMAEKRGLTNDAQGRKSLYFSAGLLEGTETIAIFVLFCLFPAGFPVLATIFGALCLVTAVARVANARHILKETRCA